MNYLLMHRMLANWSLKPQEIILSVQYDVFMRKIVEHLLWTQKQY